MPAYCTIDDIISVFSEHGVHFSVDDDRTGTLTPLEDSFVDDAISRATINIDYHLNRWYDLTTLPGNIWIKWCAATLAAKRLARRRGELAPDGLVLEAAEYEAQLLAIMQNQATVPSSGEGDASLLTQNAGLTMSNLEVDSRYANAKVRANPLTSTRPAASKLPRFMGNQFVLNPRQ